eukprot:scaffold42867_cov63-Phaeocystis_antarctica.AAC.2
MAATAASRRRGRPGGRFVEDSRVIVIAAVCRAEEGENLYVPEYASQLQQGPFELAGYIYAELSAHRAVLDIAKEQLLDDQDDMTGRPPLLFRFPGCSNTRQSQRWLCPPRWRVTTATAAAQAATAATTAMEVAAVVQSSLCAHARTVNCCAVARNGAKARGSGVGARATTGVLRRTILVGSAAAADVAAAVALRVVGVAPVVTALSPRTVIAALVACLTCITAGTRERGRVSGIRRGAMGKAWPAAMAEFAPTIVAVTCHRRRLWRRGWRGRRRGWRGRRGRREWRRVWRLRGTDAVVSFTTRLAVGHHVAACPGTGRARRAGAARAVKPGAARIWARARR